MASASRSNFVSDRGEIHKRVLISLPAMQILYPTGVKYKEASMRTDLIPDLISLGMTEREAKLYVALLEKPEWKAGELYRVTGIPRAQVHQTLELMVSRQYCMKRSEGRFNYYRPISPHILKDTLKQRWEEEMLRKVSRADETMLALGGVFDDVSRSDKSLDFIEIIQTPHRIHQRFTELLLASKGENYGINRSPYSFIRNKPSAEKRVQQTQANRSVFDKGVRNKTIMMYEEEIWQFFEGDLRGMSDSEKDDFRIIDYVPIKMFIFDKKITLLDIKSVTNDFGGEMSQLVIHDAAYAESCYDLFSLYWEKACPLKEWFEKHG